MFQLNGKNAVVTGASGGIGEAIATALYNAGANVVLTGRNEDKLKVLASKLGDRAKIVVASLDNNEGIEKLLNESAEKLGGIDILINNAGLTKDGLAMRMKDEDWEQVIDVNLTSTFKLSRGVLKGMMKNRWGRIISITSIVGVTGNPGQANYAASKAGMIGMSKSLAAEVASRNITVNCVAPGFIATAMTEVLSDDQKEKLNANIPAGRMGSPEDIAAACLFLASEEAGYMTGQTLHVNGGMAMI